MQNWVSVAFAARQLGITTQRVYAVVKSGRLRSIKMDSFRLVHTEDVALWAERRMRRHASMGDV